MKKQHYVAAVACLVAGAIGFASVYATEKAQEKKELAQNENMQQESNPGGNEIAEIERQDKEELSEVSHELSPKPSVNNVSKPVQQEPEVSVEPIPDKVVPEPVEDEKPVVAAATTKTPAVSAVQTLHFNKESAVVWPVESAVILDYNMDSTIYFPTLDQYRCNPAMIISGAVNDKVFAMARGKIIEVFDSAETGCTVRQDLGDGYIATYGQLKELNFGVGDIMESGQVVGYICEPTKYYSVEGANVYFSLTKDGVPVNPREFLPPETIDTLE